MFPDLYVDHAWTVMSLRRGKFMSALNSKYYQGAWYHVHGVSSCEYFQRNVLDTVGVTSLVLV